MNDTLNQNKRFSHTIPDHFAPEETITCQQCGTEYAPSDYIVIEEVQVPKCPKCGGVNMPRILSVEEEEECDFDENL